MRTHSSAYIRQIACDCVTEIGDLLRDTDSFENQQDGDRTNSRNLAISAVERTLQEFAERFNTSDVYSVVLRNEYANIAMRLPETPSDDSLVCALCTESAWTVEGARLVIDLANQYGTSILRNALALADALDIEDGLAGF